MSFTLTRTKTRDSQGHSNKTQSHSSDNEQAHLLLMSKEHFTVHRRKKKETDTLTRLRARVQPTGQGLNLFASPSYYNIRPQSCLKAVSPCRHTGKEEWGRGEVMTRMTQGGSNPTSSHQLGQT